ncbi:MAG: SDR family NAD(P)-dependent oxidoreductase [bacterium]|nr:SDR family NAD(P)-dependent oxidoreductase [bacterium]
MHEPLLGRRIVVTGAGSGIGLGIATALASAGASVGLIGSPRRSAEVAQTAQALRASAGRPMFSAGVDVCDDSATRAVMHEAADVLQGIDGVVCSAGVSAHQAAPTGTGVVPLTLEQFRFVFDTNVRGTWSAVRHAAPYLLQTPGTASVVTVGSVASKRPTHGVYSVSKSAVWMLTRAFAEELGPQGVRVNCLAPGFVDTPMLRELAATEGDSLELALAARAARVPLRRLGSVADMARAAIFLLSTDSSYITGSLIHADGGLVNANAGG